MIGAKIIKDSISESGVRLTTFEVILPKALLAENNTHRMLSRNYSSSRAIPSATFVDIETWLPTNWLKNQSGMVAKKDEVDSPTDVQAVWDAAIANSKYSAAKLAELGVHKQWANRPMDWCVMAKGVVTATEFDPFYWLRDHEAAQPEMQTLAKSMRQAANESTPQLLKPGQWHLPYVDTIIDGDDVTYFVGETAYTLERARMISASCCAQASYRKFDDTFEKAEKIFNMLNLFSNENPPHFSPVEHQASPMEQRAPFTKWEDGISHQDRYGDMWSGNFKNWIQWRKVIEQENG